MHLLCDGNGLPLSALSSQVRPTSRRSLKPYSRVFTYAGVLADLASVLVVSVVTGPTTPAVSASG